MFWPILLKLHISASEIKSFPKTYGLKSVAKKSGSSHLLGVVPSKAVETAFVPELSKAMTFGSYVVSRLNCTFKLS